MKLFPINFTFNGIEFMALIRLKEKEASTEYHITVMNGELEKLLYGDHVIVEQNGVLLKNDSPGTEAAKLKYHITQSLENYLQDTPMEESANSV